MARREDRNQVNVLLDDEQMERIRRLQRKLQARTKLPIRVTPRMVILQALEFLTAQLDRQEKDKDRER